MTWRWRRGGGEAVQRAALEWAGARVWMVARHRRGRRRPRCCPRSVSDASSELFPLLLLSIRSHIYMWFACLTAIVENIMNHWDKKKKKKKKELFTCWTLLMSGWWTHGGGFTPGVHLRHLHYLKHNSGQTKEYSSDYSVTVCFYKTSTGELMRASGKKNKNRAAVSNKSGRRRCHENYRLQMICTQLTKIRLGSAVLRWRRPWWKTASVWVFFLHSKISICVPDF